MQDNSKYRQQLVNKGWKEMSILLDKAMPESGKRRRTAIWWIVGTGIVLMLTGWGYFLLQSDTTKLPSEHQTEPIPKMKTAMSPVDSRHGQEDSGTRDSDSGATKSGISAEIPIQADANALKQTASPVQSDQSNLHSISAVSQSVDSKLDPDLTDVAPITMVAMDDREENITNDKVSTDDAEFMAQTNPRKMVVLAQLGPFFSDVPDASRGLPWIEVKRPGRTGTFGLDLVAATHMNADGNPFYGVEAGVGATVRAGRRVSFNAGLTYGYYNIDGLALPGFNKDVNLELDNSQGTPGQNSGFLYDINALLSGSLAVSDVKQITEKFHYLHLPAGVSYAVTSRLAVSAGIKLSTLIAAPARYNLNDNRFSSSPLSNASRDFLVSYDILRKWDIAPMVSLNFRVNRSLSFDASYAHGLVHYVNGTGARDKSDLHRTGSIGVRYRML